MRPRDPAKKRIYFSFMDATWSITAEKYAELLVIIEEIDCVPDVTTYGAREVVRAHGPCEQLHEPNRPFINESNNSR